MLDAFTPSLAGSLHGTSRKKRTDIQALRALAVSAVVIYHFWPSAVPGGFVGVDVFFVISGYLIIGHLYREAAQTGTIALMRFWAKRARRLLPAAALVLFVVFTLIVLFAPRTRWAAFFIETAASAFYMQNWLLAANSVNYLTAENVPSPVQHFWSLSVEEQLYIALPLVLIVLMSMAKRRPAHAYSIFVVSLLGLTFASFIWSAWYTFSEPSAAYFATTTRAWEFTIGGILGVVHQRDSNQARQLIHSRFWRPVAIIGWILIFASMWVISSDSPFPGTLAILPVMGALLVLAASNPRIGKDGGILSARPIQFLGDISYSLYLWHWPLIIFAEFAFVRWGLAQQLLVLSLSLLLATLSKRFVEDPILRSKKWSPSEHARKAFFWLIPAGVVGAFALGAYSWVTIPAVQSPASPDNVQAETSCKGASSLMKDSCESVTFQELEPDLLKLEQDTAGAFSCYTYEPEDRLKSCSISAPTSPTLRIALVGDSHAAMLIPGLKAVANDRNWAIDTFVGRGCPITLPSDIEDDDPCRQRRLDLAEKVLDSGTYDAIILNYRRVPFNDSDGYSVENQVSLFTDVMKHATQNGIDVIGLQDNPQLTDKEFACLSASDPENLLSGDCAVQAQTALSQPDPVFMAASQQQSDQVVPLNTSQFYCSNSICPVAEGGVIVYRDTHHITATYSKTLGSYLADEIEQSLATDNSEVS